MPRFRFAHIKIIFLLFATRNIWRQDAAPSYAGLTGSHAGLPDHAYFASLASEIPHCCRRCRRIPRLRFSSHFIKCGRHGDIR